MKKLLIMFVLMSTVLLNENFKAVNADSVSSASFNDISDHWAKESVLKAIYAGYVEGYPDGTFKPDLKVTRAEFIKLIVASLKLPTVISTNDVNWYDPYVSAAKTAGIYLSDDFNASEFNSTMTRLEMSRAAVRAAGQTNTDTKKWMYLATNAGLIMGLDKTGTLGEDQTTTRAQSITVIDRILTLKSGGTLPVDKHAVSRGEISWHGTNIFTMLPRYANKKEIAFFDLSKSHWEAADGIYSEVLEEVVVVDMADPNSPEYDTVKDMPFDYRVWAKDGKSLTHSYGPAPVNSYLIFSKVKQTIKGQFPLNMYIADGGNLSVLEIAPHDVIESNKTGDIPWHIKYSNIETKDNIYFNKDTYGELHNNWNISKGYTPFFAKDMPSTGGVYHWLSGVIIPKGDFYSVGDGTFDIFYNPPIAYASHIGPNDHDGLILSTTTDYTVHNQ